MASWGGSSVCSNQGIGSKGCYPWCLLKEAIRTLKINSKRDLTLPGHLNIQTDTYWHLDCMLRVEKNKTKPTNWKAYLCKTTLLLNHSCASWRKYRTFYVYCFHVKALVFVSLKCCLCTALLTYLKAGRAVWLLSLTILKIMMCHSRLVTAVEWGSFLFLPRISPLHRFLFLRQLHFSCIWRINASPTRWLWRCVSSSAIENSNKLAVPFPRCDDGGILWSVLLGD